MKEILNRRSFLKAAGISGAAAIMPPALSARAQGRVTGRKWRMRLSTSSIHFMGLPIEHVSSHEPLLAGAKTIFDSDSDADGQQTYCTTCHAEEHRINVRTIRWNKATGEMLGE